MTRKRWIFAAAAFVAGLLYTGALALLGVEVRLAGRDVALPVAASVELAFGAFGFWIGRAAEARASERRASAIETRLLHVEKLATVGQLASRIAHEVRNPLAIVRSMIQNLAETASPSRAEVERTCREVLEEIDRLNRVTTSLSGLSRPVEPHLSQVNVTELLARVEWLSRRLLEGRSVSLHVAPLHDDTVPGHVHADPDLTCQLLLGLVANAADAMEEDGSIELGCYEGAEEVVFRIRDEGPGIAPEVRDRVFEPFATTKARGSGLGLAVAKTFAEAQGGALVLEDVEGPGAAFALHLPRVSETRG